MGKVDTKDDILIEKITLYQCHPHDIPANTITHECMSRSPLVHMVIIQTEVRDNIDNIGKIHKQKK